MTRTNIIKDFPILYDGRTGKKLIYLDNAATTQKPKQVIEAMSDYYKKSNANVHRGVYPLSEKSSELYEAGRKKVAAFIQAGSAEEVSFTYNTTYAINQLAYGIGSKFQKGDEVVVLVSEHHSNFLPWQRYCKSSGAEFKVVSCDVTDCLETLRGAITHRTKVVAFAHVSNVLGTIYPVKEISALAHSMGAYVVVDGAQAAPHMLVNVQNLGCDFYFFSAHKMLGPMGIGVSWGKKQLLDKMEPLILGGGMIRSVGVERSEWDETPYKFEAGTPNVAGVVGLSAAIDYLTDYGMANVRRHCKELVGYALACLSEVPGLTILGPSDVDARTGLVAFTIDGTHPHDVAAVLAVEGIAVRSGQHCTMPLHTKLNINASIRASFYVYNDKADVDALIIGLQKAIKILG